MNRLLHSSKFWTAITDVVISLALYFIGKYVPGAADDVKTVIVAVQPVFALVIAGIFIEDAAAKRAGNDPDPLNNIKL